VEKRRLNFSTFITKEHLNFPAPTHYPIDTVTHENFLTGKFNADWWQILKACDMKSHLLLSHLEKGSETRCSFNGSLPVQAKLVTAWSEATGTMEPFVREGKTVR
jgi:hypothetical protein